MSAPSSAALLEAVSQAILDIVTSGVASYGDDGETYTMVDLGRLRELRRELVAEVAAETGCNFRLGVPLRRRVGNSIRR
jgi:hypothetical protein